MKTSLWITLAMAGWTSIAGAAFTPLTEAQLAEAARKPTTVSALITEASVPEVAGVVGDVIERILARNLPAAERDALIRSLIASVFTARPTEVLSLSAALGEALGKTETSLPADVVSVVQQSVITSAGEQGASAGTAFGDAYLAQPQPNGAPPRGNAPPPPPTGTQYEGLGLR